MPPKKKMKPPMPSQPGVARKYLAHNFGEYTGGNLTNGHVLWIYISSEISGMCTIQTIQEMFRQRSENCEITLSQVVSLVKRSIDYYRHLKKEEEMTMFSQICEQNLFANTRRSCTSDSCTLQ